MKLINKDFKRNVALVFFGILIWWLFSNIQLVGKYIGIFVGAISPLIIGFIIAFILNRPMIFFERKIGGNSRLKKQQRRILSLLLTLLVFLLIVFLLVLIIVPNLIEVSIELSDKFPSYLKSLDKYIKASTTRYPKLSQWIEPIDLEVLKENIYTFVKGGLLGWVGSSFSIASSVFGNIISFFIGLIFSIYFLIQKEESINSIRKLLSLILPMKVMEKILYIGSLTNKAFSDFILAQSLESVILGVIFYIFMTLFKLPYASMVSVVIAVFSIIPMVGSFVGLFVGVILIFVENPQLSGLFIILFIVLQQIEGNFIYPRVVGKLSGLSPLLTLTAITLGGSLMGIPGMLLFVPLFSVIQRLIVDFMKNAPRDVN